MFLFQWYFSYNTVYDIHVDTKDILTRAHFWLYVTLGIHQNVWIVYTSNILSSCTIILYSFVNHLQLYESSIQPDELLGHYLRFPFSFLPFPLFAPPNVDVKELQHPHNNLRLSSELFLQLPSIWSATNGTFPVCGLIFDHPHSEQLLLYFSIKYFLT